jgi:hypothetical protein
VTGTDGRVPSEARGLLVVSNYDASLDDMNGPEASAVLNDPARRAVLRAAITRAVLAGGWDGVVLDLESLQSDAAAGLVDLVAGVKSDLAGREVVVSTPASDSPADLAGYDLPRWPPWPTGSTGWRTTRTPRRVGPAQWRGCCCSGWPATGTCGRPTGGRTNSTTRRCRPWRPPPARRSPGNRHRLLPLLQAAEYVTSLNLDRRAQAVLNTMAVVPGAAGAFRRSALLEVGGFPAQTLVEDADLTMILLRSGWLIPYEPRAVAWTEAPERLRDAVKQRRRWCYGTLQVLARHADILGRPRYGTLGPLGLPWNLVSQILLPALAPLVELYLVIRLLTGDTGPVVLVLALAALLDVALVAVVTWAERESWRLVAVAPLLRWLWHPLQLISVLLSFHRWLRAEEHRWSPSRRYATVATPARTARTGRTAPTAVPDTWNSAEGWTAVAAGVLAPRPAPLSPAQGLPVEPVRLPRETTTSGRD